MLPATSAAEAAEAGERLREAVAQLPLPPGQGPSRVTASVGIAVADRPGRPLHRYYALADTALYAAQQHGRNAVWIARAEQEADGEPRPSSAVRADGGT